MAAVKSKNTQPELLLRRALSSLGLRYRLHFKFLPGRPDIVFPNAKVAVFCDGDFWHGRNWKVRKKNGEFKVRNAFWTEKIEDNIARDRRNNRQLKKLGWTVLRFWNTDINVNAEKIAKRIECRVLKHSPR
jgi:DNA mismatch endonuclease (patch repair protein)